MNKEELEPLLSYNMGATTMAHIAVNILSGLNPLEVTGVRELIALYLLIPYITNTQLDTPNSNCKIPKLDINSIFTKVRFRDGSLSTITLDNLRNALCHSFVTITDEGDLVLDDRASLDKKSHSALTDKGSCNRLELKKTREKLLNLHNQVIKQQMEFNATLQKEGKVNE